MAFAHIRGQEIAVQMLKNSITHNHVSHAYLFQGIEGIGKKSTALAFAQVLNCLEPRGTEACDKCLSCLKIKNGNHPDLFFIEPEKYSIKIEQIRNLRNKVFYKCSDGGYKVIILEDAHFLTIEAANSLLKVLEEPPEETVFILITSEPGKLPDTILSRCQQVQFQPLSVNTIKEILKGQYPGETVHLGAGLSGGSLVKAKEICEEGDVLTQRQDTLNFLKGLFEYSFSEVLFWCEKWDKEKQKAKTVLEIARLWYRDLLVYKTTGREEILINHDYITDIKNSGQSLTKINNALSLINESIKHLEYNVSPRLILEVFFMKLKLI